MIPQEHLDYINSFVERKFPRSHRNEIIGCLYVYLSYNEIDLNNKKDPKKYLRNLSYRLHRKFVKWHPIKPEKASQLLDFVEPLMIDGNTPPSLILGLEDISAAFSELNSLEMAIISALLLYETDKTARESLSITPRKYQTAKKNAFWKIRRWASLYAPDLLEYL